MDIQNASPSLYNEDLAPAKERHWGAFSIFNVWTSDVHSLWGYYLAASLFLLCGSFLNFVVAIGLGSLVIFGLMSFECVVWHGLVDVRFEGGYTNKILTNRQIIACKLVV